MSSHFPVGTTVTCTTTDEVTNTSQVSFKVTVLGAGDLLAELRAVERSGQRVGATMCDVVASSACRAKVASCWVVAGETIPRDSQRPSVDFQPDVHRRAHERQTPKVVRGRTLWQRGDGRWEMRDEG
jgi:hypothetical protein